MEREKVLFVAKSQAIVDKYYDGPYAFLNYDDLDAINRDGNHPVRKERIRIGILIDHSDLSDDDLLKDLGCKYSVVDFLMSLFFGRNIFFPYVVLTNEEELSVDMCHVRGEVGLESHLLNYTEGFLQKLVDGHKGSSMSR